MDSLLDCSIREHSELGPYCLQYQLPKGGANDKVVTGGLRIYQKCQNYFYVKTFVIFAHWEHFDTFSVSSHNTRFFNPHPANIFCPEHRFR